MGTLIPVKSPRLSISQTFMGKLLWVFCQIEMVSQLKHLPDIFVNFYRLMVWSEKLLFLQFVAVTARS